MKKDTLDLFDLDDEPEAQAQDEAKKLARREDPPESHAAAEAIVPKLGELQAWVWDLVDANPGLTCNELAAKVAERDPRTIGRRLPELLRMGEVAKGESRVCSITGRTAATWYVVEKEADRGVR